MHFFKFYSCILVYFFNIILTQIMYFFNIFILKICISSFFHNLVHRLSLEGLQL